jgi:hypothetical protein
MIEPKMLMCIRHWKMLPKPLQALVWHHYRIDQEIDKKPSLEYITVAFVSVSCVALAEGRDLPSFGAYQDDPG